MSNTNLLDLLTVSLATEHVDHDTKSMIPSITRHLLNFSNPMFSRIVVFGGSCTSGYVNQEVMYYDYIENIWSVDPVKLTTDNVIAAKHWSQPLEDGSVLVVGTGRTGYSQEIYRVSPVMITKDAGLNTCFERIYMGLFTSTGPVYQCAGGIFVMISRNGVITVRTKDFIKTIQCFGDVTLSTCIVIRKTKILLIGGVYKSERTVNCYLFDSVTLTLTLVAPMHRARYRHSACRLPNGNVFVCGGADNRSSCEEYDVDRNIWMIRNIKVDMYLHNCVSLGDGRVLIVGGGSKTLIYDSVKKNISDGQDMPFAVYDPIIALGEALA